MFNPGQMASQAAFRAALGVAGVYAHQKRGNRNGTPRPSSRGGGLRAIGKLAVFALFVTGIVLNFVAWPLYNR